MCIRDRFYGGRTNWRLVFINIRQRERVNGVIVALKLEFELMKLKTILPVVAVEMCIRDRN